LEAPLTGREAEIASLLASGQELKAGTGRIVSLIGEAGLGKSRLIAELHQALAADASMTPLWIEGRSLSYESNVPFAPFINLFTQYFDLQPGPAESAQYSQIKSRLGPSFNGRSAEIAPFFATLLGIPLAGEDAERVKYLAPPHLRSLIFNHVFNLLEQIVSRQSLVMVIDDLHWCDPTSLELLL
jgi:predicted ATPase